MFFTYSTYKCVDMDIGVVSKRFLYTYKYLFFLQNRMWDLFPYFEIIFSNSRSHGRRQWGRNITSFGGQLKLWGWKLERKAVILISKGSRVTHWDEILRGLIKFHREIHNYIAHSYIKFQTYLAIEDATKESYAFVSKTWILELE